MLCAHLLRAPRLVAHEAHGVVRVRIACCRQLALRSGLKARAIGAPASYQGAGSSERGISARIGHGVGGSSGGGTGGAALHTNPGRSRPPTASYTCFSTLHVGKGGKMWRGGGGLELSNQVRSGASRPCAAPSCCAAPATSRSNALCCPHAACARSTCQLQQQPSSSTAADKLCRQVRSARQSCMSTQQP